MSNLLPLFDAYHVWPINLSNTFAFSTLTSSFLSTRISRTKEEEEKEDMKNKKKRRKKKRKKEKKKRGIEEYEEEENNKKGDDITEEIWL